MSHLKLENIKKHYGSKVAVDSVTASFGSGCTAILGPNGAGKTTLMKIITHIINPSGGRVVINGLTLSDNPQKALENIGSLIEQPEFYPYVTGREALEFIAVMRDVPSDIMKEEINYLASRTGIVKFLDSRTGTYSKGMKQRLGLAAAMISEPDILILDEPTFGLDPRGIIETRDLIRSYSHKKNKSVILSTHLISEATEICDRVVILDQGSIKYDSILRDSTKKIRVVFETKPEIVPNAEFILSKEVKGTKTILFEIANGAQNSRLVDLLVNAGLKIKDFTESKGLEDIYLSLIHESS